MATPRSRWLVISTCLAASSWLLRGVHAGGGGLCAHMQQNETANQGFTDGELVDFWQQNAWSDPRTFSVLNRPEVARAVFSQQWGGGGRRRRPSTGRKDNVSARINLAAINEIDEKGQYFLADGTLILQWSDDRLCFNSEGWLPSNVPGCSCDVASRAPVCDCCCGDGAAGTSCSCLQLQGDKMANMSDVMWFPDVFVSNTLSANPARVDMREQRLTVSSDGHVTLRRRFIDRVNCHLKLRDMPFDHQRLAVQVGSFGGAIDLRWIEGSTSTESLQREHGYAASGVPQGWRTCSEEDHCVHGSSVGLGQHECFSEEGRVHCLQYVDIRRYAYPYVFDYIFPAVLLVLISYLALFVEKSNPGRPGIHSVTVLTELTLASAQRKQLPPVKDEMWIIQFQNMMLMFHVLIFVEYGVVHYAERQKIRLKNEAKRRLDANLEELELEATATRPIPARRSAAGAGASFSTELPEPIGRLSMPSVVGGNLEAVAQHLSYQTDSPDSSSLLGSCMQCRCFQRQPAAAADMRATLVAVEQQSLQQHDVEHKSWHRFSGAIDWGMRVGFPPVFFIYVWIKIAEVDAWSELWVISKGWSVVVFVAGVAMIANLFWRHPCRKKLHFTCRSTFRRS
jgi:hypothetical protein